MDVVVTGSSGFIGSALVPVLQARGHRVVRAPRGDAALKPALRGAHAIVHLANVAHARVDEATLREVNVEGSRRAAEFAEQAGVARFVYLSSVKALGEESVARPLADTDPEQPQDAYGRSKLEAERAIRAVGARGRIRTVVLRPPLVYGPGVKANFLLLMRAVDSGWPLPFGSVDNRRSLVFVGNLCDAIARCVEADVPAGRAYSVTDGEPLSTAQLCRQLGAALGRPARLFPFPPGVLDVVPPLRRLTRSLELDDSAIRRELGWQPPFGLAQGLERTVAWYRGR